MKRTNIVLDVALVDRVKQISGETTVKGVVHYALQYCLEQDKKARRLKKLLDYRGSGEWKGDLDDLRRNRV